MDDWQSQGNEMADFLAKKANVPTSEMSTLDKGGVYLDVNGTVYLSGVKNEIAVVMRAQRQVALEKLHQQSTTIKSFRKQYSKIANEVRVDCVESDNESLWSFFVSR